MGLREMFGGGLVEDVAPSHGDGAAGPDLGAAQARAKGTRKGGRQARLAADADARDLDAIFSPEACADLACLYHDARAAQTGSAAFVVEHDRRMALGTPLAAFLKRKAPMDPGWAALGVFLAVWSKEVIRSEVAYRREVGRTTRGRGSSASGTSVTGADGIERHA